MSRFLDKKLDGLCPYTPGEQPNDAREIIKLNTNESPFPPSPKVLDAITRQATAELRLYPDPECRALKRVVADYNGVRSENVMTGNGSDEILALCFHGLCENGAVFADVTYGFYKVYSEMFSVSAERIPLAEDFSIDISCYDGYHGTVFIANPNAPTGLFIRRGKIEEALCNNPGRLHVIDEAYIEFGGDSCAPLLDRYDNLIVVRTMSKSHSLAGARLGYALAGENLISDLEMMRNSFNPYNINRLSLIAGAAAIADSQYYYNCRIKIIENRDFTTEALRRLGFRVLNSKANFIFAGEHPEIEAGDYAALLKENRVLVRYFDGKRTKDFVRITIGTREQMDRLVSLTAQILKEVAAKSR